MRAIWGVRVGERSRGRERARMGNVGLGMRFGYAVWDGRILGMEYG